MHRFVIASDVEIMPEGIVPF